jgi:hypothetical protein
MRCIAIFVTTKARCHNVVGIGGGNHGNTLLNTFPFCFGIHNRTFWYVKMPGGHALSAHGAGWLIIRTGIQTKMEKDTYAKLLLKRGM